MRTPSKMKRKDTTPDEHEEHVCSVLLNIFLIAVILLFVLLTATHTENVVINLFSGEFIKLIS